MRLKLSLLHGCRTCNKQNVPGALAAGITCAGRRDDAFERGPFTDAEKAVIAYADEVVLTNAEGRMTPELFGRARALLRSRHLELGVTMAIISGMAKLFVIDVVEKELLPICRHRGRLVTSIRTPAQEWHESAHLPITMPKWVSEMQQGTITNGMSLPASPSARATRCSTSRPKIVNSVEAPVAGTLRRILADSGATEAVGALIAVFASPEIADADGRLSPDFARPTRAGPTAATNAARPHRLRLRQAMMARRG